MWPNGRPLVFCERGRKEFVPVGLFFDDQDFDGQLLRALSYAAYGGADVGECFETASRIKEGDRSSWYEAWTKTADRMKADAEESLRGGHTNSACRAFMRASNYYRAAEFYVRDDPKDPRSLQGWQSSHDCFAEAARLFDPPFEAVEIPYEGTTLPGYFFRVDDSGERRPTVITMSGMDGYLEECYWSIAAAGLERGYNCLAFDGPGQGGVLRQREVPFRPDWEAVVTPVLDFALQRPEVDPDRLAIVGRSFGGYLAPRAASAEHRLAACVADPGQFDLFDAAMARVPQDMREALLRNDPAVDSSLDKMMEGDARHFFIAARMRAYGAKTLKEFLLMQRDYTLKGLVEKIECPTLVCDNVADSIAGGQAKRLYEALKCPKDYVLFTAEQGAEGHCEGGAQVLFHRVAYDWLDKTLAS
jgi:dienelactone hydrolase